MNLWKGNFHLPDIVSSFHVCFHPRSRCQWIEGMVIDRTFEKQEGATVFFGGRGGKTENAFVKQFVGRRVFRNLAAINTLFFFFFSPTRENWVNSFLLTRWCSKVLIKTTQRVKVSRVIKRSVELSQEIRWEWEEEEEEEEKEKKKRAWKTKEPNTA